MCQQKSQVRRPVIDYSRVTLDTVLLAQVSLDSAVDLGNLDALVLEGGGGLLVVWGEGLAVSTPRGEELRWNSRHVVSRLRL